MHDFISKLKEKPTYRAAGKVAGAVKEHFAKHIEEAGINGEKNIASVPSEKVIESIIDTAFWASLRREEGYSPKISLAFLPPEQAKSPLVLKQRLPLTTAALTKIAPGVERAGIHLGVWVEEDELYIWGTTQNIPFLCFVLDVSEPGLLVIKHRHLHGFAKFTNVAVLIGDQIKMIDQSSSNLPDCPNLLTSLLGFNTSDKDDSVHVLVQMAVSMRKHGHGGILLVVPAASDTWHHSIIHPVKYTVAPAFSAIADLMQLDESGRDESLWKGALHKEISNMAGLTAIDGATIINDKYELLAFGAKIMRRKGQNPVERMLITEPIAGGVADIVHPSYSGGTRHLSAAQFVHDQHDSLALVASQDGRFTIFSWSPCEEIVQAHRIDTLLL